MKNFRPFTTILAAMLISAAAIFYSCSKQETEIQTNGTEPEQMTQADIDFQNQLVHFKEKLEYQREHPGYKSGEAMDADSAIFQIETLFNATYSFADDRYGRTQIDRTTVMIDISNNDEVLLADMVNAFDEIINVVTQFYINCPFQQKGFILLDLKKGELLNNQLEINIRSIIGEKSGEWDPFGPDDCWWYGEDAGDCDLQNGGTDAAEKIQEAVNASLVYIDTPPEEYRYVYSNTETFTFWGDEWEDENGNKLMFYIENPTNFNEYADYKVDSDELNFYYYGELEVIFVQLPESLQRPSNWRCLTTTIDGYETDDHQNTHQHAIFHRSIFDYAYRNLVKIDVIVPPVPLVVE